jgi:CheY-like chemotaxis protein
VLESTVSAIRTNPVVDFNALEPPQPLGNGFFYNFGGNPSDVEVLFRQQFRRELRVGRFTMEFAPSAAAGLKRITDAETISLILILSDINMPGMSGLELLPKARAARPDVPIIMITAYGDADTKRKALESGAEALFTKPIDFVLLRTEIETRVERAA